MLGENKYEVREREMGKTGGGHCFLTFSLTNLYSEACGLGTLAVLRTLHRWPWDRGFPRASASMHGTPGCVQALMTFP